MEKIPVTIITGFLGSGKTTLLNHLLRNSANQRIAVLVNDFGEINIDSEMIVNVSGETISLTNGCVCCTIRGDLVNTVKELLDRPELPEHIVVEVSGVSDPNAAAMSFVMSPKLAMQVQIDGIIAVLDTEQFELLEPRHRTLAEDQITAADVVILNKIDLATTSSLDSARHWVNKVSPRARVLTAVNCEVPSELILGVGQQHDGAPYSTEHHQHDHSETFSTWSWRSTKPMGFEAIYSAFQNLKSGIFRAKGFLHLGEVPDRQVIVQMVGKRVSLSKGKVWHGRAPDSRIVVIGMAGEVHGDELSTLFKGCRFVEGSKASNQLSNAVIEILRK